MEADAKAYDEVSALQIEAGSRFIRDLNLSPGEKVLDMGCGTGHLTKYIADIVGPEGQAVGIDPDAERIKIAEVKYKEVSNLQFHVGSSAIGFPHDSEPYYDVHISTNAFHWVSDDEKRIYIRKAHHCLKPEGKLAIWCITKALSDDEAAKMSCYPLTQEGYRGLFEELGLFNNVVANKASQSFRYKSLEEFKQWFKASCYKDPDDYPKLIEKYVTSNDDGQIIHEIPCISITAYKN